MKIQSDMYRNGFTLLELMLSLCIIGLLFTVTLPRMKSGANNAKLNIARQHATEIGTAVVRWVHSQDKTTLAPNKPFAKHLLTPDSHLVDHYTGNPAFKGISEIMHSELAPKNPFNKKSYFAKENDAPPHEASKNPGLIYLASTVYKLPVKSENKSSYRYFCLLISRGDHQWFDKMNNLTVSGVRNGIYVAQEKE